MTMSSKGPGIIGSCRQSVTHGKYGGRSTEYCLYIHTWLQRVRVRQRSPSAPALLFCFFLPAALTRVVGKHGITRSGLTTEIPSP